MEFRNSYAEGFPGITEYKKKASKTVREKGYILLCPITGHKTYWSDFEEWKEQQKSYTREFWDEYKTIHKPAKDEVYQKIRKSFQRVSKFDRKALNSPTQGEIYALNKLLKFGELCDGNTEPSLIVILKRCND